MKVIIMMGLPGSGKSTAWEKHFKKYIRINQDTLGTRDACVKAMVGALEKGHDVLVDRVNITKRQRKYWIDVALQYGAEAVVGIYLDVPEEECVARIHARKNHPTINDQMPLDKKREIVYSFNRSFEMPELSEGFSSIVITRN